MRNLPLQIVRSRSRGVGRSNLIHHREYRMLRQGMNAPSLNIRGANLGDLHPMELAKMDLRVLPLSKVQSHVGLSYMSHQHQQPIADHQRSDETALGMN